MSHCPSCRGSLVDVSGNYQMHCPGNGHCPWVTCPTCQATVHAPTNRHFGARR